MLDKILGLALFDVMLLVRPDIRGGLPVGAGTPTNEDFGV